MVTKTQRKTKILFEFPFDTARGVSLLAFGSLAPIFFLSGDAKSSASGEGSLEGSLRLPTAF